MHFIDSTALPSTDSDSKLPQYNKNLLYQGLLISLLYHAQCLLHHGENRISEPGCDDAE